MYQNVIYIFIYWYSKICWFSVKKCWYQQDWKWCVKWCRYFFVSFGCGKTVPSCAKFHHCWICETEFREGDIFGHPPAPLHPWAAPKKPILNRVKLENFDYVFSIKTRFIFLMMYHICFTERVNCTFTRLMKWS